MSQPEAALVVPLVEVQGGHVLHLLPLLQEGLHMLVEPRFVPQAYSVQLTALNLPEIEWTIWGLICKKNYLVRVYKLAGHDDRGVSGERYALH